MVVVETNVLDHLVIVPQSLHERSRIADTRHGDHLLAVIQFLIHELREERPRPETCETGKVNTLIGDLNQNLAQDASVYPLYLYVWIVQRYGDEFFYYRNLGVRRRELLGVSCGVDFILCYVLLKLTAAFLYEPL